MYSYVKQIKLPLLIVLGMLAITLVSRHYHISSYLNIEFLQRSQVDITLWSQQHFLLSSFIYLMLVTLLSIPMLMPGVIFIPIIGGFFLGFWPAFFLSVIGVNISFAVKFVFFYQLYHHGGIHAAQKKRRYSQKIIEKISKNFNAYKLYYFLLLRLVPGFPSWIFSGVAVSANMTLRSFLSWVFFATMPATALYVYIGMCMVKLLHGKYATWEEALLSPRFFFPILILLIVVLSSFFYCLIKTKNKN